eukprot:gnl/MRDRNA2_/MRDRNA2_33388_c0_seq1.p1 gnl/MRDRNA2_/MRDRNA2_33388_c0~~gnl/MRDRNA2_/MRDRNA2_33388_c0_seq1.p1  ORF type:complete len:363 (+),score=82.53 gnl/MRDRNA2_/MRDRNA2_33388_c0_seq1:88-1176(+)
MWCTEGGMRIIQSQGADLERILQTNISNLRAISDTSMRDADTTLALLQGLKPQTHVVQYDPDVFSTLKSKTGKPLCQEFRPKSSEMQATVKARVDSVPKPQEIQSARNEVEQIVGKGNVGNLMHLEDVSVDAKGGVRGAAAVLKSFSEDLLYSYASGIHYLEATPEQRMRLIKWQYWGRSVQSTMNAKTAVNNAALLNAVLDDLVASEPGVSLYVGHDSNEDGIATLLDLTWTAPPFATDEQELFPTPPGSSLLLEYDAAREEFDVSFIYTDFDGTGKTGTMQRRTILSGMGHEKFHQRVMAGLRRWRGAEECYLKVMQRKAQRNKGKDNFKRSVIKLGPSMPTQGNKPNDNSQASQVQTKF